MRLALCSSLSITAVLLSSAASPAAAEELTAMAAMPSASSGFALSTCFPARWAYDEGAISLSYGFAGHFAVRANVASYKVRSLLISEASVDGRVRDAGLGLVWYPRRLWSGLTLELGAIARSRQATVVDIFADYERETSDATIYAGRGLIGWSWDWKPVFVSVAAGLSIGTGRGTESFSDYYREPFERAFNRRAVDIESYFRFGFFFGV